MGDRAVDPFDVITRVNPVQVPRDALPTGAIEPVIVVEQPPASDDVTTRDEPGVVVDPAVTAQPAVQAEPVVVVDPELSGKLTRRLPELPEPAQTASAIEPSSSASDERLASGAVTDRIARMRGVRPITKPPHLASGGRERRGRGGTYAALAVSIVSVAVSAGVVMWARGEVRRARNAHVPPPPPMAKLVADASQIPSRAAAPEKTTEPPAPPSCFVHVTSSVDDAIVWIDGERHGEAPALVPVACGERATIEVRRPRFREFKSAVVVTEGTVVIDARLERKRRL